MTPAQGVLAALVAFFGAAVQGSVGFGLSLVAAPILILINPGFVPVSLNIASLLFNLLIIRRERGEHFWREMRWPIIASVPGSIVGAAVVRAFAADGLGLICGVLVLVAVGLIVSGIHLRRTTGSLTFAGGLGGFMGTAVGIGGPPLALLYSNADGPEIRGALSRYFGASAVISLVLLAVFGQVHRENIGMAAVLLPGIVVGYLISGWLARHINRSHVRVAVLALSTVSAALAIVNALV
jgi:uncharacterized membrane protein YfcA